MIHLYFDFETFSSEDIVKSGAYRYTQSPDFEILLLAYAFDNGPVTICDLSNGGPFPLEFTQAIESSKVIKHAHNSNFERLCLKAYGINVPVEQFSCSAVKSLYCGLPASLDNSSKALGLSDKKDSKGKALIKYFCTPQVPSKKNGFKTRMTKEDDPEAWEQFKQYCIQDVVVEREIVRVLSDYEFPECEKTNYWYDQLINDRGAMIDVELARNAVELDELVTVEINENVKKVTNLENPNSGAQFKKWLTEMTGQKVTSLAKESFSELFKLTDDPTVLYALEQYSKGSKTSTSKYEAAINSVGYDDRIRGLLYFYGANRTGRYAGRIVQIQNLPRNKMKDLDLARRLLKNKDYESIDIIFDNPKQVLSELIRTMFIPKNDHVFAILDFSAIEARVLAWLAGEKWRLDVFASHGKIYEASASMMFGVPLEQITKDSEYRTKGKIAELALGYQGSVGAMERMGGESMGLSQTEMKGIVTKWRKNNPKIVSLWENYNNCAIRSVQYKGKKFWCQQRKVSFESDEMFMMIGLPCGRKLFYHEPKIVQGKFGDAVTFNGLDDKNNWSRIDTYGGKLVENVTQAVSRDLLAYSIYRLEDEGYPVCMHIHDEVVVELHKDRAESDFKKMEHVMSNPPSWALDLPLRAEGFLTDYYKKD